MFPVISFKSSVVLRASQTIEVLLIVILETEVVAFVCLIKILAFFFVVVVVVVAGSFNGWSIRTYIIKGNQFYVGHQDAIIIPVI